MNKIDRQLRDMVYYMLGQLEAKDATDTTWIWEVLGEIDHDELERSAVKNPEKTE